MSLIKPKLSIDKVSVRYEYLPGEQGEAERYQLYEFKGSLLAGWLENPAKVWSSTKNAMTYMAIELKGGSKLLINYGYCSKRFWSWVTFNPSKMTEADFLDVRWYLELLYEHNIHTLWQHGDLKQLDVACDVATKLEDYLFLDETLRIEYRHLGTLYLGAEKGSRHLAIYDKRKERLDKAGIELGHPLLRVEARLLKPKEHKFGQMQSMANPFAPLHTIDRAKLEVSDIPILSKFSAGLAYGMEPGQCLNYFSAVERKDLFQALPSVAPDWWKPEELWKSYPDAFDWVHQLF